MMSLQVHIFHMLLILFGLMLVWDWRETVPLKYSFPSKQVYCNSHFKYIVCTQFRISNIYTKNIDLIHISCMNPGNSMFQACLIHSCTKFTTFRQPYTVLKTIKLCESCIIMFHPIPNMLFCCGYNIYIYLYIQCQQVLLPM